MYKSYIALHPAEISAPTRTADDTAGGTKIPRPDGQRDCAGHSAIG